MLLTGHKGELMANFLVIKCGGSVLEKLPFSFYKDIVNLQKNGEWVPVLVHGGGPLISTLLNRLNIKTSFHNGLRVTTNEVLDVVEMVLGGSVNKQVVGLLQKSGGKAIGLSGVDGNLLTAAPIGQENNLGFVGDIVGVQTELIKQLTERGYIPVISPLAADENGQRYNINGDMAAAAIAKALKGHLCFISDVPGIQVEENGVKTVLKKASQQQIEQMIDSKAISGGMLPKVNAAVDSLRFGIPGVVILNGLDPNSLLDFTNGMAVGTKITLNKEVTHVK